MRISHCQSDAINFETVSTSAISINIYFDRTEWSKICIIDIVFIECVELIQKLLSDTPIVWLFTIWKWCMRQLIQLVNVCFRQLLKFRNLTGIANWIDHFICTPNDQIINMNETQMRVFVCEEAIFQLFAPK